MTIDPPPAEQIDNLRNSVDFIKFKRLERSGIHNESFVPPADHSSFLKLSGFQLLAEKTNLLFYGAVSLDSSLNTVDRMQGGGMIAVK